MIEFKKGEFIMGELTDIVHFDFDEVTGDNWWDYHLSEECWILEIPKDLTKLDVYNVGKRDIHFIPRISEIDDKFYEIFWNSNETYVFRCFDEALNFISNYDGYYEGDVEDLHEKIMESFLVEETVIQFSNLEDLDKDSDVDFLNELEDFVDRTELTMDSILTSMKLFMLEKYRHRIQEQNLSRLN